MMDLLRTFRLVAQHASFTKAAREAGLTRPAVSQQIKQLESHFQVTLLERNTRQVKLTDAGRALLFNSEQVLAAMEQAEAAMAQFRHGARTVLVVGASTLPGENLLPQALAAFRRAYPDVEVQVREANTDAVLQMLRHGEVALGLVGTAVDDPPLVCRVVAEDEIVLALPPGHPSPDSLPLDELRRLPIVLREPGSATRAVVVAALRQNGLEERSLRVVAELGSPGAVKAAVRSGLGAAFVSRLSVTPGELTIVRVDGLAVTRPICACWRRALPPTGPLEGLLACLSNR